MCLDTLAFGWLGSFDIPYRDIVQLTMVEGLLHAIRENGQHVTINVMTEQIVERPAFALPAGATLLSLTSTTDQVHPRWHNRTLPADVNEDGRVNSSDVLTLINTLLVDGARSLNTNSTSWELRSYQYDVTNDLRVNTSDLLAVINQILLGPTASADSTPPSEPLASEPLAAALATPLAKQPALNWIAFAAALDAETDEESIFLW
jgi:hypothetical protein